MYSFDYQVRFFTTDNSKPERVTQYEDWSDAAAAILAWIRAGYNNAVTVEQC